MQCFKCKQEIPDDTLRCPHCGIKVNMYCPECHTLNRFGSKYCSECGSELLKVCLKCGSNNLYYATNCRKCGASLDAFNKTHEEDLTIIEEPEIKEETTENKIIEEEPETKPQKKMSLAEFMNAQAKKEEIVEEKEKIEFIKEEEPKQELKTEINETEGISFIKKDDTPEKAEDISPAPAPAPTIQPIAPAVPPVKKNTPRKIQNCITTNGAAGGNRHQIKNNQPKPKKAGGGGFFGFGRKKEQPKDVDIIEKQAPIQEEIPEPKVEQPVQTEEIFVPENTIETIETVEQNIQQAVEEESAIQFVNTEAEEEETTIQFINTDSEEEEKKNLTFEADEPEAEEILTEEFSPVKPSDILEFSEPVIPSAPEKPALKFEPEEEKMPIIEDKTPDVTPVSVNMENYSFEEAKQAILNAITNVPKHNLIAVTGDCGSGKTILLQQVLAELSTNYSFLPFFARCSNTTQVSCLGAIQDAFLSLLGLPASTSNNINAFIKENKASLKQALPGFSDKEITDFVNFLYPNKTDVFANIEANKTNLFSLISKAIGILSQNSENVIIALDNFSFIDGMSYEFLTKILDNEIQNDKIQIIIAYQENRSAEGYFASHNVNPTTAKTIHLKPMTQEEASAFGHIYMNGVESLITKEFEQDIYNASRGSSLYIEQFFAYLYEFRAITIEENLLYVHEEKIARPITFSLEELIKERLKLLMPQLKVPLFTAAILGYRFDNQIFAECLNLSDENANTILGELKKLLYMEDLTAYSSVFRSYSVWEILRKEALQCDEYKGIIKNMIKIYSQIIVSSPMDIVRTFEHEVMPANLIAKLNEITSFICALGDTNLYTIAQKLKLKFIDKTNSDEYENLACEIYEELGMLNYRKAPKEAISYLSNAIDRAQKLNNPVKAIDLCGYLVNSCYLTGNYYGVIETVDLVLKNTEDSITELEKALIKERKLKALYSIGNCEEIINMMTNEISVVILDTIQSGLKDAHLRGLTTNAWVESNIILASAYAMQGNPLAFETITDIKDFLPTINSQSPYFKVKTQLIEAFAFTSIGDLNNSNELLADLTNDFDSWSSIPELLSEWNLISLINKTLTNTPVTKEELFEIAAFANNSNEYFVKNIIKLILGYFIQKDGDSHKALEIYNEQITYFAKEKNAIGALLSWYLIAQATMVTEDASKALNIAQKALEVAQGPKINNYNFIIYLKKFIAEVYMSQGDLESAKMHIEQAMSIAQENGLFYAQFKLMLSYAEYLEESLPKASTENDKSEIALDIIRVHKEAQEIAKKLNLKNLDEDINNAQAVFKTYCKLNNITPSTNLSSETII